MVKTSGEIEKEFMDTAREKTGKALPTWFELVRTTGFEKRNEIISWLKSTHRLNHLQAQLIAGIYLNNGKPVYKRTHPNP